MGYWARATDDLLDELGSSRSGLKASDAAQLLRVHGRNILVDSPRAGPLWLFFRQFANPLILILVVAAVIAGLVHEPADSIIILAIVLGSAMLTMVQEYRATTAVDRLRARIVLRATAMRDGVPVDVPAADLVAGDVVIVSAGTLIPADGVLLEGRDLFVNQGVLTGESMPVEKMVTPVSETASLAERTNVLFSGTSVRSGTGQMVVVATGMNTVYGGIARRLTLRQAETEFERGIRRFGYLLARVILVLVLVVFAANIYLDRPPIDSLLFAIALAVGISPELLPAIIGVTLARGARQMASEGVIVRRLNAIENFGSMDVLCSDKTGTLTEGAIRLQAAVDPAGDASAAVLSAASINAHLQTGIRNPIDEAIIAAGRDVPPPARKLDEIPYDFVRRRVTVVVEEGAASRLVTKGAFTQVLEICSSVRHAGTTLALDAEARRDLEGRLANWSDDGFRVLALASRVLPRMERYGREDESDLTLEGFLLFADRPKDGVEMALRELRDLGVRLIIITGDNRYVARHVAKSVGLGETLTVTGAELDVMTDEALWRRATETTIFAEVDPNQKERIIRALQKIGHVVGFLGDGINDAPALHAADVGISVDSATDVARETADIVLLKRELDVLRRGIVLGRTTFANTLKYINVTTSANFGNMVSMAVASLLLPFLPLLATQILLNSFLSDLPAVALAGDRVDAAAVKRPKQWEIRPIRRFMIVFGLVSSAFDFMTFALLLYVFAAGAELFRTGWFLLSLLTELVVIFIVRTPGPLRRSRPSRSLIGTAAAIAAIAVALPFSPLATAFQFVPLPPALLAAVMLLTVSYGIATMVAKRWFYGWGVTTS
jgi:Mg2+-importing ATPase